MFDLIDTSNDNRIQKKEFKKAKGLLFGWGLGENSLDACFAKVDKDRGGMILFEEFASWAIATKLRLSPNNSSLAISFVGDPEGKRKRKGKASSARRAAQPSPKAQQLSQSMKGIKKKESALIFQSQSPPRIDWNEIAQKLPIGDDENSEKQRKKLWKQMDSNGNGLASLAEIDKVIVQNLDLGHVAVKPVIMRAYQAAKGLNKVRIV